MTAPVPVVGGSGLALGARYVEALPALAMEWQPAPVAAPQRVVHNAALAADLGIDPELLASADGVSVLAGNAVPAGATPVAMAYAGHQFGGFSPRLGDGRALLLGEVTAPDGTLHDVHLKGSGRTPFARGGDGRATLPSMLREYVMAEAMHALGVPTTRALAVVATGEHVARDGDALPGGVLTRTATSHLRVGTFQYAALLEQQYDEAGLVLATVDHAIERHLPEAAGAPDRALRLLAHVVEVQASLVARWMSLGFIHGVMNTDNVTISGETIDYGPCAFMDRFDPSTVYSSIDHNGRYAYENQPGITHWNLVRLAESLLHVVDDDQEAAAAALTEVLQTFPARYEHHWLAAMRTKLGLVEVHEDDASMVAALLDWLHAGAVDWTSVFRALGDRVAGDPASLAALAVSEPAALWVERWSSRVASESHDPAEVAAAMHAVNPLYIPRNHTVDEALVAAGDGDLAPFFELLEVVTHPYVERDGLDRYARPAAPEFDARFRTFCGT